MTKTIRAFIALNLPDDIKRIVVATGEQLAPALPERSVRWVKPNAMHLTLRFLGETAETLLPAVGQALDAAVAGRTAFTLHLDGLGVFPNTKRPRVLWLGLAPTAALGQLKAAVDAALLPLGWAAERGPFTPHLTLGRVRDGQRLTAPDGIVVPAASFPVTALHLIESDLRPDGPRYTVRHSAPLHPG